MGIIQGGNPAVYFIFLFSYSVTSVCHLPCYLPLSLPRSDILVLSGINTSGERSLKLPHPNLFPVVLPVVGVSLLKNTTK